MKRLGLLFAALVFAGASSARAAVLYSDDFTTPQTVSIGSQSTGSGAGKIFLLPNGSSRAVDAEDVTLAVPGLDSYNLQIFATSGGFLDLNASSGASGTAHLSYGLPNDGLNIAPGDFLRFTFTAADAPNNGTIDLRTVLTANDNGVDVPAEYDSPTVSLTTGGPQVVDIPLNVDSAGLLTRRFDVYLTSAPGLDYRLDSLSIQSVPEPAALGLLGIFGTTMLARRRR